MAWTAHTLPGELCTEEVYRDEQRTQLMLAVMRDGAPCADLKVADLLREAVVEELLEVIDVRSD